MSKILVTGCSGYIGSHLCAMLDKDHEVHGLDIVPPRAPLYKFHDIDINRPIDLEEKYDTVVHLAALVKANESVNVPIQYYITNLNGTMNVINRIQCDNFILASTGLAELCNNPYAISKRAAEDVVREYCTQHSDRNYTIFRFYNVIGTSGYSPTNQDGLMAALARSVESKSFTIYGNDYDTPDGTCIRDYLHVDEVCNSIMKAITNPSNKVECLGHGKGRSVLEMFYMFKLINGLDIELKIGPRREADAAVTVLKDVSPYMEQLYNFEDYIRV